MKDWFRERFHGLYWRQMAVTVGMVFLTLVLLGVSFFSLSYSYARGQKTDELMVRAMAVSKLSVRYLETGRYLSMEELQKDEQFRQLAATAAVISEMDILVCDMDGHVLLSTDAAMEGRSVTIPSSVMDKVSADGTWAGRSRLVGRGGDRAVDAVPFLRGQGTATHSLRGNKKIPSETLPGGRGTP